MSAPITIKKKKKLTIKSKSENAEPKVASGLSLALPGLSAPPIAAVEESSASYTIYATLAIITTLMFIGILTIQWMEWTYLLPAFPRPIPTGM